MVAEGGSGVEWSESLVEWWPKEVVEYYLKSLLEWWPERLVQWRAEE